MILLKYLSRYIKNFENIITKINNTNKIISNTLKLTNFNDNTIKNDAVEKRKIINSEK
jgi:hypothetical protein